MSLIEIVEKFRGIRNVEFSEPESEPTLNPQRYPYIACNGIRYCYLTHHMSHTVRNGTPIYKWLVRDVWDGQHRWIGEKELIVNSWFTLYDGVQ